jgi:hypothetical protein
MKTRLAVLELLHEEKLTETKLEIMHFFFVSFGCEFAQNVFTVNVRFCIFLLTKRKTASSCSFSLPTSYHAVPAATRSGSGDT